MSSMSVDDVRLAQACPSCQFLIGTLITDEQARRACDLARLNGSVAAQELITAGLVSEDIYYQALAAHYGLTFFAASDIAFAVSPADSERPPTPLESRHVWCKMHSGELRTLLAPSYEDLAANRLTWRDAAPTQIGITAPSVIRTLLIRQHEKAMAEQAVGRLVHSNPAMSAHSGARFWQGAVAMLMVLAGLFAFSRTPGTSTLALHFALSVFFFSCVWLRVMAAMSFERRPLTPLKPPTGQARPVYSVLVCLYREADVAVDLIKALNALRWPRSRLQILLVCEADDEETLAALEGQRLAPWFEIVRVPDIGPRTKPKALNYALQFANGKLVTIYDAEDRPHPDQLNEAWQTFLQSPPDVACLQAPLVTANLKRNAITALFHFEYAGLFGALLPWLARIKMPILLGGTSNHFKRNALEAVGAWDPYNVTEDADLGLRLWRSGYRTSTITRPTLEDAPHQWGPWLRQRTRWYKGWLQTWVVHSRQPLELLRNVGLSGFIITQILLAGTLLSALAHPVVLFNAIVLSVEMAIRPFDNFYLSAIAWIDWTIVLMSYAAFTALCCQAVPPRARRHVAWAVPLVPLYWLGQSIAAWRGVLHLFIRPFEWEKTPHGPHQTGFGSAVARPVPTQYPQEA